MKVYSNIKLWLPVIFLLTHSIFMYPQQKTETPMDSSFRYQGINPALNFNYKFDNLLLFNNFNYLTDNIPPYNNSSTIWLRTEMLLSTSMLYEDKTGTHQHFTSPLYQKYLEDSKFDPVRYVLGMAQLSAVGYLAYKHIKRYGFWK